LSDETTAGAGGMSCGAALGPDWTNILPIHGNKQARSAAQCCRFILAFDQRQSYAVFHF